MVLDSFSTRDPLQDTFFNSLREWGDKKGIVEKQELILGFGRWLEGRKVPNVSQLTQFERYIIESAYKLKISPDKLIKRLFESESAERFLELFQNPESLGELLQVSAGTENLF